MTILRKTILSLVCLLSIALAFGQTNPEFYAEQVLTNTNSSTIFIESQFPGSQVIDVFTTSDDGNPVSAYTHEPVGNGDYEFTLHAGDIVEDLTYIIKYYISVPNSFIPRARYMYLNFSVVESILTAERDYLLSDGLSQISEVTSNDYSSANSFGLEATVREQDLSALITGSSLDLVPFSSENKMYAQYVIEDSIGTHAMGTVIMVPESAPEENITLNHYTTNKSSVDFTLPSGDYTLDENFGNPSSISSINAFAQTFSSANDFVGIDSVKYNHTNGTTCTVYFQVYDKTANNGFLRDDIVYVARNQTAIFSVLPNDLEEELTIVASSADDEDNLTLLNPTDEGLFSYTPDQNYEGIQNFTYSCIYLNELQTANIKVIVADQEPVFSNNAYNFVTMENTPYVFDYKTLVNTASFVIAEPAQNGTVHILDSDDQLTGDCYDISGENKIVYIPNDGFSGADEFTIYYSPGGNLQYGLTVDIEVVSSDTEDCYCSTDCVYQGDVDNDGKVDLLDLFAFGNHFGSIVEARTNDSDLWIGQSSEESSNAKYADIDGNGIVDENDLEFFFDYHGASHAFYQNAELISSEYSIFFEPQVETIDSGELLRINVLLGDDAFPAIEVNGISFALNAGGAFADSASMNVIYEANSWFCHNDPTIALTHVPYDGRIETAVVNTANSNGSGQGIVAVVEFIVEEDSDDIRLGEDQSKLLSINFNDIYIAGANNQIYKLAPQTIEIPWGEDAQNLEDHVQDPNDLILYPNPAQDFARLYLNGPESIEAVNIFNLSGQLIESFQNISNDGFDIPMESFQTGMYIINVQADKYNYSKKLSVIR